MKSVRILAASALIGGVVTACGDQGKDNLASARVLSVETRSLDNLNITVKELETPAELKAEIAAQVAATGKKLNNESTLSSTGDDLTAVDVAVDQIINIGKKVWAIVAAGQPVMNV